MDKHSLSCSASRTFASAVPALISRTLRRAPPSDILASFCPTSSSHASDSSTVGSSPGLVEKRSLGTLSVRISDGETPHAPGFVLCEAHPKILA